MKVLLLSLFILLSVVIAPAKTDEQISIKAGQQRTAKTGRITVKFLELLEDSRCPADVNCIWAGVGRIKIRLSRNGNAAEFELNTNQKDKPAVFQGYTITLKSLTPYPTTTSKYSQSAYTATLVVSKTR